MNRIKKLLPAALILSAPVFAVQPPAQPVPEPLAPPPVVESELLEPEVTIIERADETLYEYRINGQVYMVRIQPSRGPAYYLLDMDGDGDYDVQGNDPAKIVVPNWVLFRW